MRPPSKGLFSWVRRRFETGSAQLAFFSLLAFVAIMGLMIAGVQANNATMQQNAERAKKGQVAPYEGGLLEVSRDEQRKVTCYVYRSYGVSCVRDSEARP